MSSRRPARSTLPRLTSIFQNLNLTGFLILSLLAMASCSVQHGLKFKAGCAPQANTKVAIGTINNLTGETFDVDITNIFKEALHEALKNERLLWSGSQGEAHLILTGNVIEYKKGSAFKRTLLPGWGLTVFAVRCDLQDSATAKIIGTAEARRTVGLGGPLSVGEWRTIVDNVAYDVVNDLGAQLANQ